MSVTAVVAGLLEAIELATTLIRKVNAGDMTPEEATREWEGTSSRWGDAVTAWNITDAPPS